jgi:hypothetical protein
MPATPALGARACGTGPQAISGQVDLGAGRPVSMILVDSEHMRSSATKIMDGRR